MTPSNPAPVGDEREALIDAWSMEEHGFPDQVWFTRKEVLAILARFGTRPAAEPSQSGSAGEAEVSALISRYTTALLDWGRDGGPYAPVEATRKDLRAALSRQAPAAPAEALDEWARNHEFANVDEMSGAFMAVNKLRALAAPTPAEPAQQDTRERFLVIRESHHNAAETEYFSARPHIDTADRRRVFYAGFCKGYDAKEDAS